MGVPTQRTGVTGTDRDDAWDHHPDGAADDGPRAVGHDPPEPDRSDAPDAGGSGGPEGGGSHAAAPNRAGEADEEREWDDPPGVDDDGTGENVFGSGDVRRPVEAGTVVAENAAFVLVGVLVALGAVLRLLGVF